MTTEEKIDAIHEAVIQIKAEQLANKVVCATIHKGVDARLDGLHRVVKGNGQPGLEQKHSDLETRLNRLETRVVVWASVAVLVGQMLLPRLSKALGWE